MGAKIYILAQEGQWEAPDRQANSEVSFRVRLESGGMDPWGSEIWCMWVRLNQA